MNYRLLQKSSLSHDFDHVNLVNRPIMTPHFIISLDMMHNYFNNNKQNVKIQFYMTVEY